MKDTAMNLLLLFIHYSVCSCNTMTCTTVVVLRERVMIDERYVGGRAMWCEAQNVTMMMCRFERLVLRVFLYQYHSRRSFLETEDINEENYNDYLVQ